MTINHTATTYIQHTHTSLGQPTMSQQNTEFIIEHMIFHQLLKKHKRQDLEWLYLAIQTAMSQKKPKVDVGEYLFNVLPAGYNYPSKYSPPYTCRCLAFFSYLYNITIPDGSDNYCTIHFSRKYDQNEVSAHLKLHGKSTFWDEYHSFKNTLDASREKILLTSRWSDSPFDVTTTNQIQT